MSIAKQLIEAGLPEGPHMPDAIKMIKAGTPIETVVKLMTPEPPRTHQAPLQVTMNMDKAGTKAEELNYAKVEDVLRDISRTPGVTAVTALPDACPTGAYSLPVGGVVASKHLHPGFHSADVCCSLMLSELKDVDPKAVMQAVEESTHFGPNHATRKTKLMMYSNLEFKFSSNLYLKDLVMLGHSHLATQGDGNHFSFVGIRRSTGNVCVVTHHGSRGVGAALYKKGLKLAEDHTRKNYTGIKKEHAFLERGGKNTKEYWRALQIVREWTKANHEAIHEAVLRKVKAKLVTYFWNEHNFVFDRDGLYYHAKGATPAFKGWAEDATDLTLIPLNMAHPILIAEGLDNRQALGFSPHGAGRLVSRTEHKRGLGDYKAEDVVAKETKGLDVRFFSGKPDVTELPSAYKTPAQIIHDIDKYKLAKVVDYVDPFGSMMAGDVTWRR